MACVVVWDGTCMYSDTKKYVHKITLRWGCPYGCAIRAYLGRYVVRIVLPIALAMRCIQRDCIYPLWIKFHELLCFGIVTVKGWPIMKVSCFIFPWKHKVLLFILLVTEIMSATLQSHSRTLHVLLWPEIFVTNITLQYPKEQISTQYSSWKH